MWIYKRIPASNVGKHGIKQVFECPWCARRILPTGYVNIYNDGVINFIVHTLCANKMDINLMIAKLHLKKYREQKTNQLTIENMKGLI